MSTIYITRKQAVRFATAGIGLLGVAAPATVFAQDALVSFMRSVILDWIMWPFVQLLNLMIVVLIQVSSYNNFADADIVTIGWTTLRDLSNMFFVLILLIIAISTILKWQQVNYKQNLRRLILMALLINFSKTIVIFFIDFSQIITLTFISAVRDVLQAGIITALGLDRIVNPTMTTGVVSGTTSLAGNLIIFITAAIMILVALLVVTIITLIFAVRIIALWMILVFSPLAFLASTLPQTKEWYDRWWKTFGSNLTVAPALAFMLWLVFALVAKDPENLSMPQEGFTSATVASIQSAQLVRFIVAIGLLMYSVRLAVSMGAAGGSFAAKIQGKFQGGAKFLSNRLAYGKSGKGGAVGMARKGLATAVTRPGDAAAGGVRLAGKLGNIATLGLGGMAARGSARGIDRILGTKMAGRMGRAGQKWDASMAKKREAFEKREGWVARTVRRVSAGPELGESGRQRERVDAEAKSMGTARMTDRQLKDSLQTMRGPYGAKRAAVAREMMNRGTIDELKKKGEDKKDGNGKVIQKGDERSAKLAQEATRLVFEESGLTSEEVDKVKERNLRHTDVNSPKMQEFIAGMLTEGKSFARKDLTDEKAVEAIIKKASTTQSGPKFKKTLDAVPKEMSDAVIRGLKAALKDLTVTAEMSQDERQKVENKREGIRTQLARFDPGKQEKYAFPIVQRESPQTKQQEVVFDEKKVEDMKPEEKAAYEDQKRKLSSGQSTDTISRMDAETLERLGHLFSPSTVIRADHGMDSVTSAQTDAILRSIAQHLGPKDGRSMVVTNNFKQILRSPSAGGRLRTIIQEELLRFKRKYPNEKVNPYQNAKDFLGELDTKISKKSVDTGESESEGAFEESEDASDED